MGKKFAIFHRADLDGHCSGAIIKKAIPDVELIPFDYGEKLPWVDLANSELIVIADVTPPMVEMIKLNNLTEKLIWIDHHIKIMEEAESVHFNPEGIRDVEYSACENAWRYFYPDTEMPEAVYLLGRYDIWKWQNISGCLEFQTGMRSRTTDPCDDRSKLLWKCLLDEGCETSQRVLIQETIDDGEICLEYAKASNEEYVKNFAFEAELDDLKLICVNKGRAGSGTFESVWDEEKYDAMLCFVQQVIDGEMKYKVSMYTTKDFDLAAYAVKHGGGGHRQACGFECKELPIKIGE